MKRLAQPLLLVGAVMVLVGAGSYITHWALSPYIYIIGATLVALAQINMPIKTSNVVLKRLRAQQVLGALLLVAAGALMFFMHRNEWIVCLSVAAVLELYTSFRIPQELEKE
ncbi:MAG: hypothetical protein IKH69_09750 [Bacteroidaceae bacterium]|nr:hypothetical protein [Bacteroidaceae bacterium]